MKGVILAGGNGTRLRPLTHVVNKHLLPVFDRVMIHHCVDKLTEADIDDILVVTGGEHFGQIAEYLGSGERFGCRFTYRVQDEAGGIAQALGLARGFVRKDEKMCVILGDNMFEDSIVNAVKDYGEPGTGYAKVMLKEVDDPHRFGVARVAAYSEQTNSVSIRSRKGYEQYREYDGIRFSVGRIWEKPENPSSNLIVTGIYFYDYTVFDIIDNLTPSDRGEIEITDVNNYYAHEGKLSCGFLDGWWTDAGILSSYRRANRLMSGDE